MSSSKFSASNVAIKPPAYCKSLKLELPPLIPVDGPSVLHGWAHWKDLGAPDLIDFAMMLSLDRDGANWKWQGQRSFDTTDLVLSLERLADPDPWEVILGVWRLGIHYEDKTWGPFALDRDPVWDTHHLFYVAVPGMDIAECRVTI